jgi:hypothetical protein
MIMITNCYYYYCYYYYYYYYPVICMGGTDNNDEKPFTKAGYLGRDLKAGHRIG